MSDLDLETDVVQALAAYYDRECDEVARQWDLDHPDGHISAEEDEAMARYAFEACREEACRCTTTDRGIDTLGCPAHDPKRWRCDGCGEWRTWGASIEEPAVCIDCSH